MDPWERESLWKLKHEVATQLFLLLPSVDKLFKLKCDASGIVVGGVLTQEIIPIAFFSEKLNESKKKYSSYDLELYSLCSHWGSSDITSHLNNLWYLLIIKHLATSILKICWVIDT